MAKKTPFKHTEAELANASMLAKEFAEEYKIYKLSGMVGVSSVGIYDANDSQNRNLCIVVNWQKKSPQNALLPLEYKGMKVFYKVVGKVRPL